MGPGMFPFLLGIFLAGLGVFYGISSLYREYEKTEIRLFTPLMIVASTVVFGITIKFFGMIPAITLTTIVASIAEQKIRPVSTAVLCVILTVFAWAVFGWGLGLPIPLLRIPGMA